MSKALILKLIEICERNSIYYSIFAQNTIVASSLKYNVLFYNSENSKKTSDKKTKINIVSNIYEYIKESNIENFLKLTICDENRTIFSGITNKFKNISGIEVLDVTHLSNKRIKNGTSIEDINYYYTEVTRNNVNKWEAIKYLINYLNINQNEVMTIGDNINDIEMIKNASLGVAMGNSAPSVKDICNFITKTNDENGVAYAILKNNNL